MKLTQADKTELTYLCLRGHFYYPTSVKIETNRKDMLYNTPLLFTMVDRFGKKHCLTLQLGKKLLINQDYSEEVEKILKKENNELYLKRFVKNVNNMKQANVLDKELINELADNLENNYDIHLMKVGEYIGLPKLFNDKINLENVEEHEKDNFNNNEEQTLVR